MNKSVGRVASKIVGILKKYGVVKAGVFGSLARGEYKRGSDIDVLVEFKGRKSLLDLIGLELELKKKLGMAVDVLTYNSISPLLKDRILGEEVRIL